MARRDGWVELRDDKTVFGAPDDRRLAFRAAEFDDFLAGVRVGRPTGRCLVMHRGEDDRYRFRGCPDSGPVLEFTACEVDAFLDGVRRGEFDWSAYLR